MLHLFFPQFTSPLATFISAFYGKREDFPFSCFVRKYTLFEMKIKVFTPIYFYFVSKLNVKTSWTTIHSEVLHCTAKVGPFQRHTEY